jgi:prepilin-type N-terminal cleavage/methylation domain-containing protein
MRRARDRQGLTLIEVLIAAAILAVGVLALLSAFPIGYVDVNVSGGQSKATAYAQQMIEQLKNQTFNPGPLNQIDTPERWKKPVLRHPPHRSGHKSLDEARKVQFASWRSAWRTPWSSLERNRAWIGAANRHTVGQFASFDCSLCESTTPQPPVIPLNGGKERLGPFFASFLLDKLEKQDY